MLTLGVIHVLDLYDPEDKNYGREQTIAENILNMDLDIIILQDCTSLQLRYIQQKVGHLAYHSKVHMQCQNVSYDVISMCARKVTNIRQLQNICGVQSAALIMCIEIPPDKSTPRGLDIEIVNLYIPDNVDEESRKRVIETVSNSVEKQSIICGDFLGWTRDMVVLRDWNRVFHFGHITMKNDKYYNPVGIYHSSGLIVNNTTLIDVANPYYIEKKCIRCCIAKRRPCSALLESKRSTGNKNNSKSEPTVDSSLFSSGSILSSFNLQRRFSTCSEDLSLTRRLVTNVDNDISYDLNESAEYTTPMLHKQSSNVSVEEYIEEQTSEEKKKIRKSPWHKFKFREHRVKKKKVSIQEDTIVEEPVQRSSYIKKLLLPTSKLENNEPVYSRGHKPSYLPVECIHPDENVKLEEPRVLVKPKRRHRKRNM